MKQLLFSFVLAITFTTTYSSGIIITQTSDSLRVKDWTQGDFIKKLGFNDSAKALINLFFKKNKRGKNQTIIGSALLIGGTVSLAESFEPGDDQKGFGDLIRPVAEPAAVTIGAIVTTSGIIKVGKYTKQKLYTLLTNYEKGIVIPQKYRKKLKRKFFL